MSIAKPRLQFPDQFYRELVELLNAAKEMLGDSDFADEVPEVSDDITILLPKTG